MLNQFALLIGYVFMIVGGITLSLCAVYWLVIGVIGLPIFSPKVWKIIKLGRKAYLQEKNHED